MASQDLQNRAYRSSAPSRSILYLVHNLSDAAVRKRVKMLAAAGCDIEVVGFCRDAIPPSNVEGAKSVAIGQTFDADLGQRVKAVLRNIPRIKFWRNQLQHTDTIVARNLEMLLLAQCASALTGGKRVIYESLDIHRSLLGSGFVSRALRAIEGFLLRRSELVLYSSPAFWREYFIPFHGTSTPGLLIENKVLSLGAVPVGVTANVQDPDTRTIGWFGNLRCRKSLARLKAIADHANGGIKILVAGKPSAAEFPNFDEDIRHAHISFHGSYTAEDLPDLYARCQFAWSIDYFEEGQNSSWLLPNRIYESSLFNCVPIALENVETGRWLQSRSAGFLISEDMSDQQIADRIKAMLPQCFSKLQGEVANIPREELVAGEADCQALAKAITEGLDA